MRSGRKTILLPAILFLCVALAAAPAFAAQIVVEGENYTDFYDIAFNPIQLYTSGSYITLMGPDYPGEWVEYTFTVSAYGSYAFSMICWGDYDVSYLFNVYITSNTSDQTQVITTDFEGSGCFG